MLGLLSILEKALGSQAPPLTYPPGKTEEGPQLAEGESPHPRQEVGMARV